MDSNNTEKSGFERFNDWRKTSATLKLLSITIILLLLLIPLEFVQSLIRERQYRETEAIQEVSQTWGGEQTLLGLVLTIPYYRDEYVRDDNGHLEKKSIIHYAHFLPDDLTVQGDIEPEVRYRGIYKVLVYNAAIDITGNFPTPDFTGWPEVGDVLWKDAFVSLGIPDMRAIRDNIQLTWKDQKFAMTPGVDGSEIIDSGVGSPVPMDATSGGPMNFSLHLDLGGTSGFRVIPLGKETQVHLTSTWPSPSFGGAFLPSRDTVTTAGFDADWKVLNLNRNYPQRFTGVVEGIQDSAFGVDLLVMVDEYQRNERSAKYAVLLIALTFLVFFFIQVMNKVSIHIMQYILVGLALCLFYVLLLSFSEQIGFNMAYLLAAGAVLIQVGLYFKAIVGSWKLAGILAFVMSFVYAFIFVIIQLEDLALLTGSIGLFLILAAIMYLSRKVDWYSMGRSRNG